MKKIFVLCILLQMAFAQASVFADEILDKNGNIIPCRVESVIDGLIEYKKNGNLYSFHRQNDSLVFNDYVDVQEKLFKKESVTRYSGKILFRDMGGLRLRNELGDIDIPWYRVKFVGVYKP